VTTPVTTTVPTTATQTTPGTTTVTTTPACPTTSPAPSTISVPKSNPFNGRAMWIWEMHYTNGGNVASIVAQAKRYGISAVYVKSSDGTSWWPQFSRQLVTELHEAGLKVCAWQYVYGLRPVVEANLGSRAAHDGADCLVIDAESQYQTRYIAAQTYVARLRKLVGQRYPVGLAGFPYVDFHLSFPYSVFLGPGGAQYNLPQMYWADIGTTVPFIYTHTYEYNEIYRRPIFPLGQLWNTGRGMSASSIEEFDLLAKSYGATGVSWWDWQSAPLTYFSDIDKLPALPVSYSVNKTPASIFRGNVGDLVIWAQEHLYGAGLHIAIDGQFGPKTQSAVRSFQRRHGLSATGVVNGLTWDALDKVTPVNVRWTQRGRQAVAVVARSGTTLVASVPAWMRRTRSRNELHGDVGAGGSPRNAKR
jgi:peptidoglycan hydrolase-like protein with peptidoglycan-binding domain